MQTLPSFLPRWRTLCANRDRDTVVAGTENESTVGGIIRETYSTFAAAAAAAAQQRFACQFANRGATIAKCNLQLQQQLKLFMHFVQASATNLIVVI